MTTVCALGIFYFMGDRRKKQHWSRRSKSGQHGDDWHELQTEHSHCHVHFVYIFLAILLIITIVPIWLLLVNATRSTTEIQQGISLLPSTHMLRTTGSW